LRQTERKSTSKGEEQRERENPQADSPQSREPDTGLNPRKADA